MAEVNETTILQEGLVKITNLRTLIGTKTFFMSDITSVQLTKQAKSYWSFLLVIGGILLLLWSNNDQSLQLAEFFNIGIVLVVVGAILVILAKASYTVQIESAAGTSNILKSTDQNFIQRIVEAMTKAIALKG